MARSLWGLLALGWLVWAGLAAGGETVPAGNYKVSLFLRGQHAVFWLLKLETKEGKLQGEVIANRQQVPPATVSGLTVKDGVLRFALELKTPDRIKFLFEGKVTADPGGKKISGLFIQGSEMILGQLEPTTLTTLHPFELNKELLAQPNLGPEVFDAAVNVLSHAAAKKAKVEEVRNWANKAYKASEAFGPTWQRETALRLGEILSQSEDFAAVAVLYARNAERMLQADDKAAIQHRTLNILAGALTAAGKLDEAKEVTARLEKLAAVVPAKFAGRKGASDRVIVVELFTGAECPPCVASDLAFDALAKTFKPKEVVLLQYHLHIPRPDPLTNPDTVARRGYYREEIEGTPAIFFNGRIQDFGGGGFDEAQERHDEYVAALAPLLERAARVKLKASATQKGSKVNITAEASELDEPSDRIRLRLALVEDQVSYRGGNRLPHHHAVVRALPGGPLGVPMNQKTTKQTVTVDLDDLRKKLTGYLDEAAKDLEFPNKERPMELKKLRVVAFVQNDATKEILQAVQVDVVPE